MAPRLADVPEKFLGARPRRSKKWDTTLEMTNGTRYAIIESVGDFISMRVKPSATGSNPEGKQKSTPLPETIQGREGGSQNCSRMRSMSCVQT